MPGYQIAQGAGGGAFDWFRTRYGHTIVVELRGGGGPGGFDLPARSVIPFAEENLAGWLAAAERLVEAGTPGGGTAQPDAGAADAGADAPSVPDLGPSDGLFPVDASVHAMTGKADLAPADPIEPPGEPPSAHGDTGCAYARHPRSGVFVLAVLAIVLRRRRGVLP